jgi:Calpain family cysteine protease/Calpain large subunit, domain III
MAASSSTSGRTKLSNATETNLGTYECHCAGSLLCKERTLLLIRASSGRISLHLARNDKICEQVTLLDGDESNVPHYSLARKDPFVCSLLARGTDEPKQLDVMCADERQFKYVCTRLRAYCALVQVERARHFGRGTKPLSCAALEQREHEHEHNNGDSDVLRLPAGCGDNDYDTIVKMCALERKRWMDTSFGDDSWRRVTDWCERPKLFRKRKRGRRLDGVVQGDLGDCWFLSALCVVAENRALLGRVVPQADAQEWLDENGGNAHACCFRFRFYKHGAWQEVLVDDRLPTRAAADDGSPPLRYCASRSGDEFYGALIEKAYAKLHGSYASLDGGTMADGIVDLTGGICEQLSMARAADDDSAERRLELWQRLKRVRSSRLLAGCSHRVSMRCAKSTADVEASGLIAAHAYSIVDTVSVRFSLQHRLAAAVGVASRTTSGTKVRLVKLRNPWAKGEWRGAWCDGSELYELVSASDRKRLFRGDSDDADDGIFYMMFEDWLAHFNYLVLGVVPNTSMSLLHRRYRLFEHHSAADDREDQFIFDVHDDECKFIVGVAQPERRGPRYGGDSDFAPIGFSLVRTAANRKQRIERVELDVAEQLVARVGAAERREQVAAVSLSAGRYVLIVDERSSADGDGDDDIMVRFFSDASAGGHVAVLQQRGVRPKFWRHNAIGQLRIAVRALTSLPASADRPYVVLRVERHAEQTPTIRADKNRLLHYLFAMRSRRPKIVAHLYQRRLALPDIHLGKARIEKLSFSSSSSQWTTHTANFDNGSTLIFQWFFIASSSP